MMNTMIPSWLRHDPVFANVADGIHSGGITRTLATDVPQRYLLAKAFGSSGEVALCDTSSRPVGVMTDAGSQGDVVHLSLIGNTATTLLMTASQSISKGASVYAAADGKVRLQPGSSGFAYLVGVALTDAQGDGSLLEVEPVVPQKTALLSPFSGNSSSDLLSLSIAMEGAPDRLLMLQS
jgi:hypothetical protein